MQMHSLHGQLIEIHRRTGIRALSAELELVLQVYAHGRLTSNQLMQKVRCSLAGFGILKKRLLESGLIVSERCTVDRRVTYISLNPAVFDNLRDLDASIQRPREDVSIFSNFTDSLILSAQGPNDMMKVETAGKANSNK